MQRVKMRLTKSQYCFLFHICLVDWMAQFFFSSFFCVYYLRRKKCMKQFSIKCWFALLCSVIGPEILSLSLSLSQPIRCKTSTNHDLVTHVFPRLRRLARFPPRDEATRSITTPHWLGCQSILRLPPSITSGFPDNSGTHSNVSPKNTTQCHGQASNLGPSAMTERTPRLE